MSLAEVRDFNVLVDNKPFFDQQTRNVDKLVEMSRNNNYTTENFRTIKIIINSLVLS